MISTKIFNFTVCTNPPTHRQNTITKYAITKEDIVGTVTEPVQNYDLMSVIIMGLHTTHEETQSNIDIINLLSILLSTELSATKKKQILENHYHIPMTKEIAKEVTNMCNISDGVEARGIKKGISQGISQALQSSIKSLMQNLHLTAEQAMDALDIPTDERSKYMQLI